MLGFFWGENDFLALEEIKKKRREFLKKNPLGNFGSFDLEEEGELDKFLEKISSGGGFFSNAFLAVAKNFFRLDSGQEKKLISALEKMSDQGGVIFFHKGEKIPKGKLANFLKKKAKSKKFSPFSSLELVHWVKQELDQRSGGKVQLDEAALNRLIFLARNDPWVIGNELDKLINFVGEGLVETKTVELFLENRQVSRAFDLVDAVGTRDRKRALRTLMIMLENKEDGFLILGSLVGLFRNLAKVYSLAAKGRGPHSPEAARLKIHPFVLEKTFAQLKNFSLKEIKKAYALAGELDQQVKTGKLKIEDALVELVARL